MEPSMIVMLVVLVGGMLVANLVMKRSQTKRADERERMLNESLVPGGWLQTFSGFFGRYVETDGNVVILETPGGEETYWLKAAIKGPGEPPFEIALEEDLGSDDHFDHFAEELASDGPDGVEVEESEEETD